MPGSTAAPLRSSGDGLRPKEPPRRSRYLDPEVLAQVRGLTLRARMAVEGFFSGMHRSAHRGASIEFADHRAYTQGDDLRYIDWKVFGKTDKYYIKEYEQETNLDLMLAVDGSRSMDYRSPGAAMTKYQYAAVIAAAVSYLALRQRDSVGLALFDERVTKLVRPSNAVDQWRALAHELANKTGDGGTRLAPVLQELTQRLTHRMLVIFISDLLDDVGAILKGFQHLRYHRHELIVWNVWDRAELTFPFLAPTRFDGLESAERLLADPKRLRPRYLAEVTRFQNRLRRGCGRMGADLAFFDTSTSLAGALSRYLATRNARLRRRRSLPSPTHFESRERRRLGQSRLEMGAGS